MISVDAVANERPPTPPSQPNFGVQASHGQIEEISRIVFPNLCLGKVQPLPSGKSFNNRIYFLSLVAVNPKSDGGKMVNTHQCVAGQQSDASSFNLELVLKVTGRGFDARKILNEVGCLQLVAEHCPLVPVPRVSAWSNDGRRVVTTKCTQALDGANEGHCNSSPTSEKILESPLCGGWILMSRVEGRPISEFEFAEEEDEGQLSTADCTSVSNSLSPRLNAKEMLSLGTQLGRLVAQWRTQVPLSKECGNVMVEDAFAPQSQAAPSDSQSVPTADCNSPSNTTFRVAGILHEGIVPWNRDELGWKITTLNAYYDAKLRDKVRKLQDNPTFEPNRCLVAPLQRFIKEVLPDLKLDVLNGALPLPFVFTHYDLSPRNVLISPSLSSHHSGRYTITGVVDFEFAGLFPHADEFLNDTIANEGDWPAAFYNAYLASLRAEGVPTPLITTCIGDPDQINRNAYNEEAWKLNAALEALQADVAPWYLPGPHTGDALRARLDTCRVTVESQLEALSKKVQHE